LVGEDSWRTIPMPSLTILFSAVLVLSCGQTDRRTDTHRERENHRITDTAKRFTPATVVGVSNNNNNNNNHTYCHYIDNNKVNFVFIGLVHNYAQKLLHSNYRISFTSIHDNLTDQWSRLTGVHVHIPPPASSRQKQRWNNADPY